MRFRLRRASAIVLFFGFVLPAWRILEAQPLRVPYVSLSPTAGPLWIAYEAGLFKRNNVGTELLYIPGGSTIIQAIISGDVKIANMAPPSAIGAFGPSAQQIEERLHQSELFSILMGNRSEFTGHGRTGNSRKR